MKTSLARRQQRRLNGGRRRGGSAGRSAAIAFPLFLFGTLAALALIGFIGVVGAYAYYSQGLDDPKQLEQIAFNQESVIYDRTGTVELARFGTERRQVATFADLSPQVLDATTAVEDKTFWTNTGFDPVGILSAAIDTLRGDSRGASTITQQLVRQRLLDPALVQDPNRKVERKVKEIIQSIRLTEAFPGEDGKQRIITAYLNQNFYGNNNYGIKAAALNYFGVSDLHKLTLAQAAILAAIPQSPTAYDLVRNAVQQSDGKLVVPADSDIVQRRNFVLDLMEQGRTPISGNTYSAADFEAAKQEPVVLAPQTVPSWRAPHFVWAVRDELTAKLCDPGAETCPLLEQGGLKIITTLDWRLQQIAEKWTKAAAILPHAKDPKAYAKSIGISYQSWMANLRNKNLHNGAMVAMDYQTGEILAYVGSADYYSKAVTKQFQPQFDVAGDGWRQIGSSFKPFNYATGINDRTMTAATMFMDVTTNFGGNYIPTDADNRERGPVRLRGALEFSLNIPAVKALAYNGVSHVFDMAKQFGLKFETATPSAGLSLTLGTQEVHPVDVVTGYSTLANGGKYLGHTTIERIIGPDGKDLVTPYAPPSGRQVVSPQAAYIMTDILAGNTDPKINPFWGKFKVTNSGGSRRPATLKTGTNNDAKDLNAYGYIAAPSTSEREAGQYALAVGAWAGNSDNSLVSSRNARVFSIDVTTYMWQGFMNEASRTWKIDQFVRPPGITTAPVDAFSGLKPGPFTTKTINELFIAGTEPTKIDDTKVAVQVEKETNTLWQDGCFGTPITRGYLNLSNVEPAFPNWQVYDRGWIARAARGSGVLGGPGPIKTRTTYFVQPGFYPFGATWGAPFAPTKTCSTVPVSPSPSDSGSPGPSQSALPVPPPTVKPRRSRTLRLPLA
ncbi:MAG TPA: transglycosylase domain-containing protein [Candidatus Dormibacteraeota bacterium]|nr:transglycosylase domain-containing protein [Candidatus Dormibacteraeota bacterium]